MISLVFFGLLISLQGFPSSNAAAAHVDANLTSERRSMTDELNLTDDISEAGNPEAEEILSNILSLMNSSEDPAHFLRTAVIIDLFKAPRFKCLLDGVLKRYPDVMPGLRELWGFLSGPESKPLVDSLFQFLPLFLKDMNITWHKMSKVVQEDKDMFTWQALRLWVFLQKPQVMEVFEKFKALKEFIHIAAQAKKCGFDILDAVNFVESSLGSPLELS